MNDVFTFDTNRLSANIKKLLEESPKLRQKAMKAVAAAVEAEVKMSTPMDEGTLTADVTSNVQEVDGIIAAVICIPANAPSSKYAVAMHENKYNLGEKSLSKQAKTGRPVGSKYIYGSIMRMTVKIKEIIVQTCKH